MRKDLTYIIYIIVIGIALLLPSSSYTVSYTEPDAAGIPAADMSSAVMELPELNCDGATPIAINTLTLSPLSHQSAIQSRLDDYASYQVGGAYKLCFNIKGLPLVNALTFNHSPDKPVLISGLKTQSRFASPTSVLFTIEANDVTVKKGEFFGRGVGTGILLRGEDIRIKSSKVQNFRTGIFIDSSNILIGASRAAKAEIDSNQINGCRIGIYQESGTRNKFSFNIILSDTPIRINPSLEIRTPQLSTILGDKALRCYSASESGEITARWIQLDNVDEGQEILIYESPADSSQAEFYVAKCTVTENDTCIISNLHPNYPIPIDECGLDMHIAVVVNDTNYTSPMSNVGSFDGSIQTPITFVGVGPGPADLMSPGGGPGVADTADFEESDETQAAQMSQDAADVSVDSGISSLAGKCGGTIIPSQSNRTVISGLTMWWLIFTIPIAILCVVRIKKKK